MMGLYDGKKVYKRCTPVYTKRVRLKKETTNTFKGLSFSLEVFLIETQTFQSFVFIKRIFRPLPDPLNF